MNQRFINALAMLLVGLVFLVVAGGLLWLVKVVWEGVL